MEALNFTLAFFASLLLALIFVPFLVKVASIFEILDSPTSGNKPTKLDNEAWRKIHSRPIPLVGGLAIILGFLIPHLIFSDSSRFTIIVGISLLVFVTGFVDDIKNISPKVRILIQTLCASAVIIGADLPITAISINEGFGFDLSYPIGFMLSLFIIIGAINSTNMSDGLDGLAAGLVVIGIVMISFVHYLRTEDLSLIISICLPIIGATLGFLRYNTHPASIFMGDGGSNWLGFMLGILFLFLITEPATSSISSHQITIPILSAFMGSALPIIDTACVIFTRVRNGLHPTKADKRHFHHTLLRVGLTQTQSVIAIYFISMVFGISGIITVAYPPPKYSLWYVTYLATFLLFVGILLSQTLSKETFQQLSRSRKLASKSTIFGKRLRATIRYWEIINKYVVYLVLAVLPAFAQRSGVEIGYSASIAWFFVLASTFGPKQNSDFLDSTILVIGVGVLLFAGNQSELMILWQGKKVSVQGLYNYLFYFLFFSSLLFIAVTMRKKYLVVTPSDFLMTAIPIVLLLAPEPIRSDYRLGSISIRCLVLFVVLRTFAKRRQRSIYNVKIIVLMSLGYIILTSLFGFKIL